MRLIDADTLKDTLLKHRYTTTEHNQIFRYIDEQPTAYDADKVVEQLNEKSTLSRPVGWSKSYEIVTLKDAIEIVKQGGKEQ